MNSRGDLVYMDFAATSAIRPRAVADAVASYIMDIGATPGRGGHRLAVESGRIALACRQRLARLLNIPSDPGRIAFMFNATHALNTALRGTLRPGDRVVVTSFDHNSVLRPAHHMGLEHGIDVRLVPGRVDGELDMAELSRALEGARVLSINAASNVLGTRLDVVSLARSAHEAGAMVLVDAAQVVGHVPFDAAASGADLIAFAGHKGLLGPQGTGALWVREGVHLEPWLTGGTGGDSSARDMPAVYPDHLEAGTQNGPGIAGLSAGVAWLLDHGVAAVHERTSLLKAALHDGLSSLRGLRVLSPAAPDGVAIVTITADAVDPSTLAYRLDREHGVLTRSGLHCAPEAHRLLGTERTGAVRFSLGWSSTQEDVNRAVEAVTRIVDRGRVFPAGRVPAGTLPSQRTPHRRADW